MRAFHRVPRQQSLQGCLVIVPAMMSVCAATCLTYRSVWLPQLLLLLLVPWLATAGASSAGCPELLAALRLGCQQQLCAVDVAGSREACRKAEGDAWPAARAAA
jgi:hypothetical protein